MTKIIIKILLVLSGIFVVLAIAEDIDRKRRAKRIHKMNEQIDKMMELVNSTH